MARLFAMWWCCCLWLAWPADGLAAEVPGLAYRCEALGDLPAEPWATSEGWRVASDGQVPIRSRHQACWARVEVPTDLGGLALSFTDLHMARVDIDLLDGHGRWVGQARRLGESAHARVSGRQATFVWEGPVPARLYARLTPVAGALDIPGAVTDVSLAWVAADPHQRTEQRVDQVNTAAVWFLATVALVALFFLFALQDLDYGIFAAYATFQALTHFAKSGLGFVFDDGAWLWLNPALGQYIVSALSAWFYVRYGRFRAHSPVLARMGQGVALGFLSMVPLQVWAPDLAARFIFVLLPLHFGVALWGNLRGWRRGERACAILLIGLLPIAVYWAVYAVHVIGLHEPMPTAWAMGSAFDLLRTVLLPLVLCWGLADRTLRALSWSRRQADDAQNRLLDAMRGHARQLSHEVTSRTQELHQVNRSLGQALENLKERDRVRTRFFTAASHDLRQPLHAMRLLFDAARQVDDPMRLKAFMQSAEGASMALRQLLDALLDLSQLESGTVKIRDERLRIEDMVAELHASFALVAGQKNLGLRFWYPEQPLTLLVDRRLWGSVLGNLVSNALKYTDQGGVLVSVRHRDGGLLCQVWDTGPGIAEADLGRVFDEFFQVHNPHRDRDQGLGLGLSIVQRTCAVLGLRVSCRSQVGRGSVFEVWVPPRRVIRNDLGATSAPAPSPQPWPASQSLPRADWRGRWVLVVDDDPIVGEALQASMEAQGVQAAVCQTVEQVLAHPWLDRFDAFVVDQQLAGPISGADLLERLRMRRGEPIRAVIVTGNTSPAFMAAVPTLGWPVRFKPVGVDEVLSALGEALPGR